MKRNNFALFILLSTMLILFAACSGNENNSEPADTTTNNDSSEITLTMANITQEDHELSLTLKRIGDKLEKETDGRITAEYQPAGQLGNESDMMQQLNSGSIDIGNITTAQLSNSSEAFGAWLLPFLIDNHEMAYELWTSDEGMALFDTLTNENVKGLGYSSSGFRYFLSTKPVTEPNDLDNYKIRTTPSPTILDFYNELDAAPTPMPLTEVFTSLQTGVIDGIDIDSESVLTEKLTEIAQELTPSNHMYWAGAILINQDLWDRLSKEDQELVQKVVDEATKENVEQVEKNEKELLDSIENEHGVTINQLDDESQFDDVVETVVDKWIDKDPKIEAFVNKADELRE